ncbi:TPR_REGION domain-containing protein [Hirschfeldia incana]|nr:TPR_REGION domain-containing protein [Hirschfeldia incana]
MESLGSLKIHQQPFHLSFTHTSSSSSPKQSSLLIRPNSSFKYLSIKASSSSSKAQNFIIKSSPFRLFKSTCITLTTAATLLSFNLHLKPPPAIAAPLTTPSSMESNKHVTYEEQERALEEHLATHPTDVDSLRSLVEVKFGSYKLPQAIKLIDRLIKLEPDKPEWPVKKARYLTCEGDTESAKNVLEKVLAKDPLRADAYHALVVAYSNARRDWRKVERRIEETMLRCERESKQKEHREFKHLVAQIRVVRGRHSEALKLYEELVEDEPNDFWPYFCQGAIYTLLKEEDKAEEQYLKFKELVPENYNYMEDFLVNNLFAGEVFSALK